MGLALHEPLSMQPLGRPLGKLSAVRSVVNFSCPSCRQLSPMSGMKLEAGLLCVVCAGCGEVLPVSDQGQVVQADAKASGAVPSQRPKDPFTPPKDTCPKCIAPRVATAGACRKCGLVFKRFSAEAVGPSKGLARAWSDVVLRWSDPLQHERFQARAVELGELAAAGRLYSIWLAYLPQDPWGLKGREELSMLATIAAAAHDAQRSPWLSARVMMIGLGSLAAVAGTIVARLV